MKASILISAAFLAICSVKAIAADITSENERLCDEILAQKLQYIELNEERHLYSDDVGRRETHPIGGAKAIDLQNDGKKKDIVLLQYSSGAGSGCEHGYFDVMNAERDKILYGEDHNLLMEAQGISDDKYPSVCGGNKTAWFIFKGTTYLEDIYIIRNRRGIKETRVSITYLKDGAVHRVCDRIEKRRKALGK